MPFRFTLSTELSKIGVCLAPYFSAGRRFIAVHAESNGNELPYYKPQVIAIQIL